MNFLIEAFFKAAFKEIETKANKKLMHINETKVKVFCKHKTVKIFQFFKKIHQFVGDALVTGTKF